MASTGDSQPLVPAGVGGPAPDDAGTLVVGRSSLVGTGVEVGQGEGGQHDDDHDQQLEREDLPSHAARPAPLGIGGHAHSHGRILTPRVNSMNERRRRSVDPQSTDELLEELDEDA